MKKICSIILTLALVLSALSSISVTASAASSGMLTSEITWEINSIGVLTISGSGAMPEYSEETVSPFLNNDEIIKVVISDGITSIGDYTFVSCANLKTVTIASSVTKVGFGAFLGCFALKSINADKNSADFSSEDGVLFNKDKTELVQYPTGKALTSYTIPEGVKYISDAAFAYCNNLQSVVFSDTVEVIGFGGFLGCSNLNSIQFGNNLKSINESAFFLCKAITEITLPDSLEVLGDSAFAECDSLAELNFGKGVKVIGSNAFVLCTSLETVTIPESVQSIGEEAFSDCEKLSEIILADNVSQIEKNAFRNTEYYNNPENWENDVLYINNHLIKANTMLSGSYVIKDGTKTLASEAFLYCSELTSVTMPDSLNVIGNRAFCNCTTLSSLRFSRNLKSIGDFAFCNCKSFFIVTIPDSVTELGENAFDGCTKLAKITLSKNITEIKSSVFYNCDILMECVIPDGVIGIGENAFYGCEKLVSIALPASVKSVGQNAFYDNQNLKYVFYGGSEDEWRTVTIENNNSSIENAVVHYNSADHSYYTEVVSQTCTDNGYIRTACSVCDIEDYEIIPAMGHDFSTQWTIDIRPSASGNGEKSHHCLNCDERADITVIPYNPTIHNIAFAETEGFNADGEITYTVSLKAGVGVSGSIFGAVYDPEVLEPVEDKSGAVGIVDADGNQLDNFSGIFMDGIKNGTEDTYIVAHTNTTEVSKKRNTEYIQFTFKLKDSRALEAAVTINCFEFTGNPQIPSNEGAYVADFISEISSDTAAFTFEPDSNGTGYVLTDCVTDYNGELTVPETFNGLPVTAIGAEAFRDCSEITSVDMPDSITSVGGSAFRDCTKLTAVDLSDSITSIPGAMCMGCVSLEDITIPDGVTNVGGYAFIGCSELKAAALPGSITVIGDYAFDNCDKLIIFCIKGGAADKYADDNNLSAVTHTDKTSVDLNNKTICTDISADRLENIISTSDDVNCSTNSVYAGTGVVVSVTKGQSLHSQYSLVVLGDTTGDSVCDVLDCFSVKRTTNCNEILSGAYMDAGDINRDGIIDAADYQAIVNKALAS